jgi:hypothetical protein
MLSALVFLLAETERYSYESARRDFPYLEQTTRRGVTHDVEGRQSGAEAAQGVRLLSRRS